MTLKRSWGGRICLHGVAKSSGQDCGSDIFLHLCCILPNTYTPFYTSIINLDLLKIVHQPRISSYHRYISYFHFFSGFFIFYLYNIPQCLRIISSQSHDQTVLTYSLSMSPRSKKIPKTISCIPVLIYHALYLRSSILLFSFPLILFADLFFSLTAQHSDKYSLASHNLPFTVILMLIYTLLNYG